MADDNTPKPEKLGKRDQASQEISDWLSGNGQLVAGVVVILLVVGLIVSFFWT